jgi:hypothetical protein
MIVIPRSKSFEIVFQRAHALLAAKLLQLWRGRNDLDWVELFNATSQHDHGWVETDCKSLLKDGAPVHFLEVGKSDALEVSEKAIRHAYLQSTRCGVLVSRHVEHLHSSDPETETVQTVGSWRRRRQGWMEEHGIESVWVERHYELLLWADTLSLLLTCRPSTFTESLELVAQGESFELSESSEQEFSLSPWPFQVDRLEVEYEKIKVPRRTYQSSQELRRELEAASRRRVTVSLSKRAVVANPAS